MIVIFPFSLPKMHLVESLRNAKDIYYSYKRIYFIRISAKLVCMLTATFEQVISKFSSGDIDAAFISS